MLRLTKSLLVAIVAAVAVHLYFNKSIDTDHTDLTVDVAVEDQLRAHSKVFSEPRIIKVTDGVFVAVGYALANMIMLEGTDGMIIVDTTESGQTAVNIFTEFRKLTNKPLKGVIVTHFHPDHLNGLRSLLDYANSSQVEIFMHSSTFRVMQEWALTKDENFRRASRQFGTFLVPGSEHVNSGIGPQLNVDRTFVYDPVHPTRTYDNNATFTVAGTTFQLLHTPGETDDQTSVWVPDKRLVLPADNIYEAFPNLYAIRGSTPRSCKRWYESLDKVRHLRAQYMVPSHTRPVEGEQEVYDIITLYRDAIQFVHDQTLRLINMGLTADQVAERVRLPPSLASHPYLQEFYGTVPWSVRGVYGTMLGWFDGNPVNLSPLTNRKRAERWLRMFGGGSDGVGIMLDEVRNSLTASSEHRKSSGSYLVDDLQWALELSSLALELSSQAKNDELQRAKRLKIESLRALASTTINANARNYYLTCARELEFNLALKFSKEATQKNMMKAELDLIMNILPTRVAAERCDSYLQLTVVIVFTDATKWYQYTLRHCILELTSDTSDPPSTYGAKLTLSSRLWREILCQKRSILVAYAAGEISMDGSVSSLKSFADVLAKDI